MKRVIFTPQQKKVIFWDWNGTLVRSRETFRHHFVQVIEEFMGRWDPIRGKEKAVLQAYEAARKAAPKKRQAECLRYVLNTYAFAADDDFLNAFFKRLNEKKRTEPLFEKHARKTLQALAKKYRMGVISNGKNDRLQRSEIYEWLPIENWFTSHSTGNRKPQAQLYKTALKAMEVPPHRAVMIGNSWKHDIEGAIKCKMDAVWIQPKQKRRISYKKIGKRQVIIVRSLREIPRLFSV